MAQPCLGEIGSCTKLDWPQITYHAVESLKLEILQRYDEVLREELSTAKTPAVKR